MKTSMSKVTAIVKQWVFSQEIRIRAIKTGPLKGIKLHFDLSHMSQIFLGLYERETFPWFRRFSQGIETGLDIGVCYGEYTAFLLLKTPAKRVFAFEPCPEMQVKMAENLKANAIDEDPRLTVVKKYVNGYIDTNEVTLDSMIDQFVSPIFAKMDVDTLEAVILGGAEKFLVHHDVRWIIETHSPELEKQCIQILEKFGYKTKIIRNAWWRIFIPELRPAGHNRWLVAAKNQALIS